MFIVALPKNHTNRATLKMNGNNRDLTNKPASGFVLFLEWNSLTFERVHDFLAPGYYRCIRCSSSRLKGGFPHFPKGSKEILAAFWRRGVATKTSAAGPIQIRCKRNRTKAMSKCCMRWVHSKIEDDWKSFLVVHIEGPFNCKWICTSSITAIECEIVYVTWRLLRPTCLSNSIL